MIFPFWLSVNITSLFEISLYHLIHFSSDWIPLSIIACGDIAVLSFFKITILLIYHCFGDSDLKARAISPDFGITKSSFGIVFQVLGVGIEKPSFSWIMSPVAAGESSAHQQDTKNTKQSIREIYVFILKDWD